MKRLNNFWIHAAVIAFMVVLSYVEKRFVEHASIEPYMTFRNIVRDHGHNNPVKLLLPMDISGQGDVRWTTTGMTAFEILAWLFGSYKTAFFVLIAALAATSYVCGWIVSKSYVFAISLSALAIFGTQFAYSYINSSCAMYPLQYIYIEANLLAFWFILTTGRVWLPRIAFVLTLLILAVCWETWLDYAIFLMCSCAVVRYWRFRHNIETLGKVRFVLISTVIVMACYMAIRIPLAKAFVQPGREAELLVTYSSPRLAIVDFVSNYFTYLFVSLTNFLPPFLTDFTALNGLTELQVVASQNGYHAKSTHLVLMHQLFYWRYLAGIVFAVYVYGLWKSFRRSLQTTNVQPLIFTVILALIGLGFSTHLLIKFRPYNSSPIFPYKCLISIFGCSLLISYVLMLAKQHLRLRTFVSLSSLVAISVLLAAVYRPPYQKAMRNLVGLGSGSILDGSVKTGLAPESSTGK